MIRDDLGGRKLSKSKLNQTNPESFHISLHWIFDPMISFPNKLKSYSFSHLPSLDFHRNPMIFFQFFIKINQFLQKSWRNTRDLSASRYTRSTESLTSHSLLRSLPALDISLPRRFEIRAKALISHRRERYLELEALSLAYGLIHAMLLTDVRSISYRINFSLTLEAYANQASSHSF